ncbi:MAG: Ig-like domain-containing protein [Tidjanibacter sp.]|nr:Ig-like domain-containing protein [Tidjanibacter sp.]
MSEKVGKRFLQLATVALFASSLLWRCANVATLQGGPKDSLPPIVVSALPGFGTTNFTGREILIGFNEYVQIKDQQKEFFTSPMMKKTPTVTTSGKGIRITILDTLEENQTYALNFGNSIVDNNEGNRLSGLRYVFSTGSEIDSMVMSGYTVSASKGDSVSNSLIFFYPAEVDSIPEYDSILLKHKPAVVARAGGNGIFIAQNLKPIDYKIYAIEDKNSNFTYDPETDMVGFLDSVHNPLSEPDFRVWYDTTRHYLTAEPQLYFQMFTDGRFLRQNLAESKRESRHKVTLFFGAPWPEVLDFSIDSIEQSEIVTEYVTRDRDTVNYWLNVPAERLADTLKGRVVYMKHDSVNNLVPDTAKLALVW